jgi:glycosyltransferase involved in cell wall biosynthesis
VLTPSLDQGRFLGDCLASVSAQTYPRIEHIVCDGGSTDNTLDLLRGDRGPTMWVSEPDAGQGPALNKALGMSSGSIIGWLNSDDAYFSRTAVANAVEVFRSRPGVDVVYGHSAFVDANGLIVYLLWAPRFSYRILRTENFIIQPAAFIRRSAISDGFIDEEYEHSMDRELWLRLGPHSRFFRLNRILAIDRDHAQRKVYTRFDLALADDARLAKKYGSAPHGTRLAQRKAIRLGQRFAGLGLVPATRQPLAFAGHVDNYVSLLTRQVTFRRRSMKTA